MLINLGQRDKPHFEELRKAKAKPKPVNPQDIFNTLPKPPGINDLYASQAEVPDAWFVRRYLASIAMPSELPAASPPPPQLHTTPRRDELREPASR